ncbi:hypothetical protein Bbelb_084690 [Branchiostoma belcheri]|nr:hypothetical protein Bbelb_084690 [Branchiostoma belcheri]
MTVTLSVNDIDRAHLLPGRMKPDSSRKLQIVVEFVPYSARNKLFSVKSKLKGSEKTLGRGNVEDDLSWSVKTAEEIIAFLKQGEKNGRRCHLGNRAMVPEKLTRRLKL